MKTVDAPVVALVLVHEGHSRHELAEDVARKALLERREHVGAVLVPPQVVKKLAALAEIRAVHKQHVGLAPKVAAHLRLQKKTSGGVG